MPSPRKFEILLDRPDHKFEPGEIVAGRLVLELNAPQTIRGIKVFINGAASVGWSETHSRIENNQTVYYTRNFHSSEKYIEGERYVLIGAIGSGRVEIQAGHHVFPFEFRLPFNIPNSFTDIYGKISYYIRGVVDSGPWKFDHSTIRDIVVEAPHDLSQSPMIAIHDEQNNSFCCLYFIDMGSMEFNVFVPTSNYAIGETIDVKINMVNKSTSVNVTAVKLTLEHIAQFYAAGQMRMTSNIVRTSEQSGTFSKEDEIVVSIVVPTVDCSNATEHCSIIVTKYWLNVILKVSGCHRNIRTSYPIEIGTKSAGALRVTSQTPMSTIPLLHNPRAFGTQSPKNSSNELNPVASDFPNRTYGSISSTVTPTAPLMNDETSDVNKE